jgi:hypothetical protein
MEEIRSLTRLANLEADQFGPPDDVAVKPLALWHIFLPPSHEDWIPNGADGRLAVFHHLIPINPFCGAIHGDLAVRAGSSDGFPPM